MFKYHEYDEYKLAILYMYISSSLSSYKLFIYEPVHSQYV